VVKRAGIGQLFAFRGVASLLGHRVFQPAVAWRRGRDEKGCRNGPPSTVPTRRMDEWPVQKGGSSETGASSPAWRLVLTGEAVAQRRLVPSSSTTTSSL
jgi:hypothetical protein